MQNGSDLLHTNQSEDMFPKNETSLQARLGLVKELTIALMDELRSLEFADRRRTSESLDFNAEVRRFEVDLIRQALTRTAGHQTRAARLLGIKLTTLHDKIKRYDIDPRNLESPWGN